MCVCFYCVFTVFFCLFFVCFLFVCYLFALGWHCTLIVPLHLDGGGGESVPGGKSFSPSVPGYAVFENSRVYVSSVLCLFVHVCLLHRAHVSIIGFVCVSARIVVYLCACVHACVCMLRYRMR